MENRAPPTLETPRLLLRPFALSDLDALASIYADADVMRYIRNGPRTYEQTAASLAEYIAGWNCEGYGVWAVCEKDNAALLGMCGFVERAELGYIFGRSAWGRGFATEAARACLRYGFERLGYERISAGALAANVASRRVLEKLGMRRQPNAFFDTHGGVYYGMTRAEFSLDDALFTVRELWLRDRGE